MKSYAKEHMSRMDDLAKTKIDPNTTFRAFCPECELFDWSEHPDGIWYYCGAEEGYPPGGLGNIFKHIKCIKDGLAVDG